MTLNKHVGGTLLALTITMTATLCLPQFAHAQPQSDPTVSMVTLQTRPGIAGMQMVVTPKGMVLPLPGPGVNDSVVQIYIGSSGGYWYVDKNGQNVDLTPYVQRLQARISQNRFPTAQVPQYAPLPPAPPQAAPPIQVVNNQSQPSNSGSSALLGATAAGLGAMTGAAIAGSWNNVPYGTPVYYGAGAHPYYRDGAGRQVNVNAPTTNNVNAFNTAHAGDLQNQQKWYAHQKANHSDSWNNWQHDKQSNPFVRSDSGRRDERADRSGGRSGARGGRHRR